MVDLTQLIDVDRHAFREGPIKLMKIKTKRLVPILLFQKLDLADILSSTMAKESTLTVK